MRSLGVISDCESSDSEIEDSPLLLSDEELLSDHGETLQVKGNIVGCDEEAWDSGEQLKFL